MNPRGNDCPPALKLVACVLLYEITAFLRETYRTLPKASKVTNIKPAPWEKVYREANRRWSMALSSMGHSQTSAQSLQSIAGGGGAGGAGGAGGLLGGIFAGGLGGGGVGSDGNVPTERKISFVLHEPDNESEEGSSNTTVTAPHGAESVPATMAEAVAASGGGCGAGNSSGHSGGNVQQRRTAPAVRPFLLRRGTSGAPAGTSGQSSGGGGGGGSFKRRSLKLRRGTKDGKDIETDRKCTHIE